MTEGDAESPIRFVLEMDPAEKNLLVQVLQLYPLVPDAHHRLSQDPTQPEDQQTLLIEALAEQRDQNRQALQKLLSRQEVLLPHGKRWQLRLTSGQVEWLLEILNDVRVGAWVQLGSPETGRPKLEDLSDDDTQYYLAMEACAHYQMLFLRILQEEEITRGKEEIDRMMAEELLEEEDDDDEDTDWEWEDDEADDDEETNEGREPPPF